MSPFPKPNAGPKNLRRLLYTCRANHDRRQWSSIRKPDARDIDAPRPRRRADRDRPVTACPAGQYDGATASNTTENVRGTAADRAIYEEAALKAATTEKSNEFSGSGSEVYAKP